MYKQCQSERSSARQRMLEQGLLQVMTRRQYEQISVSDLCGEMDIPRKSFYRYFNGKDGALYSLIDHALMDNLPEAGQEALLEPLEYMEQVFDYWYGQKPLLDALAKSNLSGILVQRALALSVEMDTMPNFMKLQDRQLREYGTMFMVCGLMSMIICWHHDGFSKSTKEMAKLAIQLFTKPLVSGELKNL